MKRITKREYEVISLYSKGLTFKEIGSALQIATRTAINYYMRVKLKDKGRVTRAKISRSLNKMRFKILLKKYTGFSKITREFSVHNGHFNEETPSIEEIALLVRSQYIKDSLQFAFKSYYRFRIALLKKHT